MFCYSFHVPPSAAIVYLSARPFTIKPFDAWKTAHGVSGQPSVCPIGSVCAAMVIPFDQGRLQCLHIFAAHKGFCHFQHAGNLKGTRRGRCPFPAFRCHAPIFPPSVPARGRFVPLRPSRDPARLPRSAGRRGLFFGNLFPRARGFVLCILLRRALACACVFSLFAHA